MYDSQSNGAWSLKFTDLDNPIIIDDETIPTFALQLNCSDAIEADAQRKQILENQEKAIQLDNTLRGIKEVLGFDGINELKNAYLENQDKGQKYDELELPFSQRVYIPNLEKENKQLKEIVEKLKKDYIDCDEYPPLTKWFNEAWTER